MSGGIPSHLTADIRKFDGTGWSEWETSFKAALLYIDALGIAKNTEAAPADAALLLDYRKRARQGQALLFNMVKPAVQQRLDMDKSLHENWTTLVGLYGTTTGMDIFVDFEKYFSMKFTSSESLTTQMDELQQLRTRIVGAGMALSESFHALAILRALPDSYSVSVQSILATTANFATLTSDTVRSRILGEETRQVSHSVAKVDTRAKPNKAKDKERKECSWCGIPGIHREKDCCRKAAGMAKGDKGPIPKSPDPSTTRIHAVNTEAESSSNAVTASFYVRSNSKTQWMLDSGCTDHITNDLNDFDSYQPYDRPGIARLADKAKTEVSILDHGTVKATTLVHGKPVSITFDRILYSPMEHCLMSIIRLDRRGFESTFSESKCFIKGRNNAKIYGVGDEYADHYWLTLNIAPRTTSVNAITSPQPLELWHDHLGHLGWDQLKLLASTNPAALGVMFSTITRTRAVCESCQLGKSHRASYPSSDTRSTEILQLIHSDLDGPMHIASIQKSVYFATFIDDYSRYVVVMFIKRKSDTLAAFKVFKALMENKTGKTIKRFRSDRGGEFLSNEFTAFLADSGIERHTTNRAERSC